MDKIWIRADFLYVTHSDGIVEFRNPMADVVLAMSSAVAEDLIPAIARHAYLARQEVTTSAVSLVLDDMTIIGEQNVVDMQSLPCSGDW